MAATKEKKLIRSKSGLRIVPSDENNRSPFELSEPPWISDSECLTCMNCELKFDFLKRRHHCRRCGKIFCASCCDIKLALPRMYFIDPVRLCRPCADVTKKENEFYDKHLKVLINGAHFHIYSSSTKNLNENVIFFCTLSNNHREITFDGGNLAKHEALELPKISSINILRSTDEFQGTVYASGLEILYQDKHCESQEMTLTAANASQRKDTSAWIAALHKGVKMMYESREPSSS